jgi:hypothetical protein
MIIFGDCMVKCVKKEVWEYDHIWSQEIVKNLSFPLNSESVCYFRYLCGLICPRAPTPRLCKIMMPDILSCRFVHRHATKMLKTHSKSSFLGAPNDTKLCFLGHSKLSTRHLNMRKWFVRSILAAETSINHSDCFFGFKWPQHKIFLERWNWYHVCERNGNVKRPITSLKVMWWNRCSLGGHVVDDSEKCGHI